MEISGTGQKLNDMSQNAYLMERVKPIKNNNLNYGKENAEGSSAIQEKSIIESIEKANIKLGNGGNQLEFSIHDQTKQIMVKVVDVSTKEVIREIPSEKILDMIASMCEMAGLFVDEKR